MRLFFCDFCLGQISNVEGDQPWCVGKFDPSVEANCFQEFFAWMVDEDKSSSVEEPPFDNTWWNEENWFIEDDCGNRRGIFIPAVHGNGQIWWRWR